MLEKTDSSRAARDADLRSCALRQKSNRESTDDVAPPRATPDARALRSESSGDMSRDASRDTVAPGTSATSRVAPSGETATSQGVANPGRFSY